MFSNMTVDSRKKNMHTWWESQDLIGNSQFQVPADKDDFGWHQFQKLPCFKPAFRRIVYTQEMQTNIYTFCSSEPFQTIAHHPFYKILNLSNCMHLDISTFDLASTKSHQHISHEWRLVKSFTSWYIPGGAQSQLVAFQWFSFHPHIPVMNVSPSSSGTVQLKGSMFYRVSAMNISNGHLIYVQARFYRTQPFLCTYHQQRHPPLAEWSAPLVPLQHLTWMFPPRWFRWHIVSSCSTLGKIHSSRNLSGQWSRFFLILKFKVNLENSGFNIEETWIWLYGKSYIPNAACIEYLPAFTFTKVIIPLASISLHDAWTYRGLLWVCLPLLSPSSSPNSRQLGDPTGSLPASFPHLPHHPKGGWHPPAVSISVISLRSFQAVGRVGWKFVEENIHILSTHTHTPSIPPMSEDSC